VNAPGRFFHLASGLVIPMIPKCGLSSTHAASIRAIKNANTIVDFHKVGRPTIGHDGKAALIPVRDPVERFRSAVWQVNRGSSSISVNEILDGLEAGTYKNQHFLEQSSILATCEGCESVTLYRFPDDFRQMLVDGGMDANSQHRNKSTDKPNLTEQQVTRVKALYAEDIKLFESI